MKRIIALICLLWLLPICASAGVIMNDGLQLQGGKDKIVMRSGQRITLRVRNSVWHYPIWHGLHFASEHPSVVRVDGFGRAEAGLPGDSMITVWNNRGQSDTVMISVTGNAKLSRSAQIIIIVLFVAFGVLYFTIIIRCFN